MRTALASLAAAGSTLHAQTPGAAISINPDRPDLTTSPQLVAPGIVQIEAGAGEGSREPRVTVAADRVALVGVRQVLLDEVATERRVGRGRAFCRALEVWKVRGVPDKAFDKGGTYSLGVAEQAVWPEINMANVNFNHGMNINLVFENSNPKLSRFMLQELGMPFVRPEENVKKDSGTKK